MGGFNDVPLWIQYILLAALVCGIVSSIFGKRKHHDEEMRQLRRQVSALEHRILLLTGRPVNWGEAFEIYAKHVDESMERKAKEDAEARAKIARNLQRARKRP